MNVALNGIGGLKNITLNPWDMWNNGELKNKTIDKYVSSIRGLNVEQAKLVLSTTALNDAQKEQILAAAGLSASSKKLTADVALENLIKEVGNKEDAKSLLKKTELVTAEQIEKKETIELTAAKLDEAVANGILSTSEAELIKKSVGITSSNTAQTFSWELLGKSIQATSLKMKEFMATNPIGWLALLAGAFAGVGIAIYKYYDAITVSENEAKESLQESSSAFNETTENIKSLNDELKTTTDRIKELESLKRTGSISIAEADELELLKKQNDALARQIALEQARQIQEHKQVLSDANDLFNATSQSNYLKSWSTDASGMPRYTRDYTTFAEEFKAEIDAASQYREELESVENELAEFNRRIANGEDLLGEDKKRYDELTKSQAELKESLKTADDRLIEHSDTIQSTIDEYQALIDAGFNLEGEDLEHFNRLKELQDGYLLYNYTLNKTAEAYDALSDAQKKAAITQDLQEYNLDENSINGIVNNLTEEQIDQYYNAHLDKFKGYLDEISNSELNELKSTLAEFSKEGNVDITVRPVVDSSTMQSNGWDVKDGDYATTFTQGEFIWQGDEENGQYVYVHYTPILPDGTVLDENNKHEVSDYIYNVLEGAEDILDADSKGIVLKVDTDLQGISEEDIKKFQSGEGSTAAIDQFLASAGKWDDTLHNAQEDYQDILAASEEKTNLTVEQINNAIDTIFDNWNSNVSDVKQPTFSETIASLNELSDKFKALDSAYSTLFDSDEIFGFEQLSSIQKAFADVEGLDIDKYLQQMKAAGQDTEQMTSIMESLIDDYLELSGIYDTLTEENADLVISMLEEQGVANASAIVQQKLALAREYAAQTGNDLETATLEELAAFSREAEMSNEAKLALADYLKEKIKANSLTISTSADIANLATLCRQLGVSGSALAQYARLKAIAMDTSGKYLPEYQAGSAERAEQILQNAIDLATKSAKIEAPKIEYNGGSSTKKAIESAAKDSAKSAEDAAKEAAEKIKEYIEAFMDFMDKSLSAGKITYQEYCEKVGAELDKLYSEGKITASDYFDYVEKKLNRQLDAYNSALKAVQDVLDAEVDKIEKVVDSIEDANDKLEEQQKMMENAAQAVADYYQTLADAQQDIIDDLEKQNDNLDEQLSNYDKVLSAIDTVYQTEIDGLTEQQNAIQDKIDAINDETDAYELQRKKEQALYDLERARSQRTKKLYIEGQGYTYQTDGDAVRDAQDNLQDIENEELIKQLEDEKDALQESIDALQKYKDLWAEVGDVWNKVEADRIATEILGENYQAMILQNRTEDIEAFKRRYIDANEQINNNQDLIDSTNEKIEQINKQKEEWESLSSTMSEQTNNQAATQQFGADWQRQIDEGRLMDFASFKDQYLAIQAQIDDNTSMINSYNEKIEYYNNLKDQWSDIANVYEDSINRQMAAGILGANWEADVLSGRLDTLNSFKDGYVSLQQQIADAAINAANAQINSINSVASAQQNATSNNNQQASKQNVSSGTSNSKPTVKKPRTNMNVSTGGSSGAANRGKITQYHTGIENGLVGDTESPRSNFEILKKYGLKKDEVPAILRKGEAVLTAEQIANVAVPLRDYSALMMNIKNTRVPDVNQVERNTVVTQNINISLPNITNQGGYENLTRFLDNAKRDVGVYVRKK